MPREQAEHPARIIQPRLFGIREDQPFVNGVEIQRLFYAPVVGMGAQIGQQQASTVMETGVPRSPQL